MMINPYFIIITPILLAAILYIFTFKKIKFFAFLIQSGLFICAIINYLNVRKNGQIFFNLGNYPSYVGINLRLDLLSSLMIVLATFLFLCALIYNYKKIYMDGLFIFLLLTLESLIIALVSSNDLFNIYILIESSTIIVSILIMYKKDSQSIYDGMIYLMVNIVSMTFFLLGIGFLYKQFGVLDITLLSQAILETSEIKPLIIPFSLMMTSLSLKSALMPLFSWLPRAHGSKSSPSIVSAILSGLYVKIGIYLFLRTMVMFDSAINAKPFFLVMGLITGVVGFILALSQNDIKLLLAYSTVSQIGLIMVGISSPNDYAYYGAIYHILNHAIFKTTLFLTAGIIVEEYHSRNIKDIYGVFRKMPLVSISAILAILGITGAPLFNASFSKYLIQSAFNDPFMKYGLIFVNLGTIITFIKFSQIFFGKHLSEKSKIDFARKSVVLTLSLLCFLGGVLARPIMHFSLKKDFSVELSSYLTKSLIYLVSVILGYLLYKFLLQDSSWDSKIKQIELGFNDICISIVIFFVMILGYTTITL